MTVDKGFALDQGGAARQQVLSGTSGSEILVAKSKSNRQAEDTDSRSFISSSSGTREATSTIRRQSKNLETHIEINGKDMPEKTPKQDEDDEEEVFMPWANPEQLERNFEDQFTNVRPGEDVSITIIREGDVETTYQVLVPPCVSVRELKLAVTAETGGVVPFESQDFFRTQGQAHPLPDEEVLRFSENDLLVLRTRIIDASELATIAKKKKTAKCSIM